MSGQNMFLYGELKEIIVEWSTFEVYRYIFKEGNSVSLIWKELFSRGAILKGKFCSTQVQYLRVDSGATLKGKNLLSSEQIHSF